MNSQNPTQIQATGEGTGFIPAPGDKGKPITVIGTNAIRAGFDAILERTPTGPGRGQRSARKARKVGEALGVKVATDGASPGRRTGRMAERLSQVTVKKGSTRA